MTDVTIKLINLHPAQLQIYNSPKRIKVVCCGRRFGKSALAQRLCIEKMLDGKRCMYMPHKFFLARKFFREFLKLIPEAIITRSDASDLIIELVTGGSIVFLSGEAPDSARGLEFEFAVIDEAAHIAGFLDVWEDAVQPTLGMTDGDALIISTPRGMGGFHKLFLLGQDPNDEEHQSFHFPSIANPFYPKAEWERRKKSVPEAKFKEEYMAIPGQNQSSAFSSLDNIQKNVITELSAEPTVVYGIDVSTGVGQDYTVVVGLSATGAMTHYDRWKLPWHVTKERLKQLPAHIPKYQDATGVGFGLAEEMKLECQNYHSFMFTTQSKAKIITELITAVQQGAVKYTEACANEMAVYEYKYNPNTNHTSYNAQKGFNDDIICATAIAYYYRGQAIQTANWKLYFA